jgi:flagellar FliL protein
MKRIFKQFTVHFISTAVCLVVLGAAFLFLRPQLGARHKPAAPPPPAEADYATMELEEFTVNLADTDRARYIKVKVALEVTDEKVAAEIEKKHLPRVRDAIIMTLSRQYFTVLTTADGKEALKRQLTKAVNEAIPAGSGKVVDILFTSLVMQ